MESVQIQCSPVAKALEVQIAMSQNKCLTCKHKYEKRWPNGGVASVVNRAGECVLNPENRI